MSEARQSKSRSSSTRDAAAFQMAGARDGRQEFNQFNVTDVSMNHDILKHKKCRSKAVRSMKAQNRVNFTLLESGPLTKRSCPRPISTLATSFPAAGLESGRCSNRACFAETATAIIICIRGFSNQCRLRSQSAKLRDRDGMDQIYQHFQEEAETFDRLIRNLIPRYEEMLRTVADAIPFPENSEIRVVDLGAGTGMLSARVKQRFSSARVTCVDAAPNMLALARNRLREFPDVGFEESEFSKYEFRGMYHAIISSLALHHLPTEGSKIAFYAKILAALEPGGVFLNADAVLAATPYWQNLCIGRWKDYMRLAISENEIEDKWMRLHREEDFPAPLLQQLQWLSELGFTTPDVLWKEHYFAVYGALKPRQQVA